MRRCLSCGGTYEGFVCLNCRPTMSVADDNLDRLIEAASVPNLADLFQSAKDSGLFGPVTVYGENFAVAG